MVYGPGDWQHRLFPYLNGHIYNIGEPVALSEAEWVAKIGQTVGWQGTVVALAPKMLPPSLALAVDWQHHLVTDTTRLRAQCGFTEPIPLEEGLHRTVVWERAHPPDSITPAQWDYAAEDAALAAIQRGDRPSVPAGPMARRLGDPF